MAGVSRILTRLRKRRLNVAGTLQTRLAHEEVKEGGNTGQLMSRTRRMAAIVVDYIFSRYPSPGTLMM